jgi:8-oxo-dGTP diphosphatase
MGEFTHFYLYIFNMGKKDQIILKNRYQVVPRTLIFLFYKDEILLLHGSKDKKIWARLFNGVGGHVERGESVLSAAYRELHEETGINDIPLSLQAIISIDVDLDTGINLFVFTGWVDNKNVTASGEGDLVWAKLEEIDQYPLVEDLYSLIPKLTAKNSGILYGNYSYQNDKLKTEFVHESDINGF